MKQLLMFMLISLSLVQAEQRKIAELSNNKQKDLAKIDLSDTENDYQKSKARLIYGLKFNNYFDVQNNFSHQLGGDIFGGYFNRKRDFALIFAAGYQGISDYAKKEYNNELTGRLDQLDLDISYRKYLTNNSKNYALYLAGNIGVSSCWFNYQTPKETTSYDEFDNPTTKSISEDQLWGFTLSASAGYNFYQSEIIQMGVEVKPGITFWASETAESFKNSFLDDSRFIKVSLNMDFVGTRATFMNKKQKNEPSLRVDLE